MATPRGGGGGEGARGLGRRMEAHARGASAFRGPRPESRLRSLWPCPAARKRPVVVDSEQRACTAGPCAMRAWRCSYTRSSCISHARLVSRGRPLRSIVPSARLLRISRLRFLRGGRNARTSNFPYSLGFIYRLTRDERITLFYILYISTLYACFPGLRSPQSGSAAMARFITSMYVCELGAALRGGVGSALGGYFHVYARLDHAHGPALRSKV